MFHIFFEKMKTKRKGAGSSTTKLSHDTLTTNSCSYSLVHTLRALSNTVQLICLTSFTPAITTVLHASTIHKGTAHKSASALGVAGCFDFVQEHQTFSPEVGAAEVVEEEVDRRVQHPNKLCT